MVDTDPIRELCRKCQIFGVELAAQNITIFPPCNGVRFMQIVGFAKVVSQKEVVVQFVLCEVLQNQLNISKVEKLF